MSNQLKLVWIHSDNKVCNIGIGTTTVGLMGTVVGLSTTSDVNIGYTYNGDGTFTEPDNPPGPTEEELWENLRAKRDRELTSTDWIMLADTPFSDSKKEEWKTYRQALRDLPANTSDINNPSYPTRP